MATEPIERDSISGQGSFLEVNLADRQALQRAGDGFHALADSMPQMVWSTLPDGDHDYYNARWYEYTGMAPGSTDGKGWAGMFHQDDQDGAWRRWSHSLATGEPYEVEYRLRRHDGEYRWTLGRASAVRDGTGKIIRWIGTCTDIQDGKEAAERNEILSRELSHRIKNIFAIISALMGMTARSDPRFADTARELQDRIAALGRAHEFVRPHTEASRPQHVDVSVANLIATILKPYPAGTDGRISVAGDDFPISDRAATPIGLVIHELATNSLKYGSLSRDIGTVGIIIKAGSEDVVLSWIEAGGPEIATEPTQSGFGSRLISLAAEQQLGGKLVREWLPEGLRLTVTLKRQRLQD